MTSSPAQLQKLLAFDKMGDVPISVTSHKSLNMVQEILFHRDILLQSDEELLTSL